METVLKMYQLNPAPAENLIRQVETFNQGRTSAEGTYTISMATTYRPYYALWRIFANDHRPLLVRTLAVTLDALHLNGPSECFRTVMLCLIWQTMLFLRQITDKRMTLLLSVNTGENTWLKFIM